MKKIKLITDSTCDLPKDVLEKNNIEVMPKCCPMDGVSKREDMKKLIWEFQKEIPNVKANIYGAIKRGNIKGWNS